MGLTKTEKEYLDNLAKIGIIAGSGLAGWQLKKSLAKVGWTKLGMLGAAVGLRAGMEVSGLALSYIVDGDEGIDKWMEQSNTIYTNRTFLGDIPIVGDLMTLLPNPLGVVEVLWETGTMIGEASAEGFVGGVQQMKNLIGFADRYATNRALDVLEYGFDSWLRVNEWSMGPTRRY